MDVHESIGVFVCQRPNHDRIDYAEDCRISSDAECERDDRDSREGGVLRHHSKTLPRVLEERVHQNPAEKDRGAIADFGLKIEDIEN